MADHLILKLTGAKQGLIKGECQKTDHQDEIDINSVDFGVVNPADMSRGGSGSVGGKPQFQVVTMSKRGDAASARLMTAIGTNETITEAIIYFRTQGGEQLEYQKLTLNDAMLTSWHQSGHESGEPTESFSLTYSKIELEYKQQNTEDGSLGGGIVATFDVKTGT